MNPQLLQDFPFFEHLDDEYLAEITKVCGERTYIKGESIFFEGEEGEELYLVLSGVVQIYQDNHSRDVVLSILE
ncbi:cyclic nucleotide-binding domain-containing protein [Paenibacillus sp. FSL L8-0494]|uniref:cyclic nucleotide-binding domain-containing protein n=1 Tax=Paenibacillus sp. FSL L8-0494 TaxID=2975352 RepID=UPI0030F8546F